MKQNPHGDITLFMAMELSNREWKRAFGDGRQERQVTIPARDQARLRQAIAKAKAKLELPAAAPIYSCYEAGRDGFWIHRLLEKIGLSSSPANSSRQEARVKFSSRRY